MTPIDIQVSRSKVKVKGHANLLHLVQLITQECFAPKASNLVSRWSLMSRWPLLIFRSVGQRSVSKVKSLFFICWGRGALVFYKQLYLIFVLVISYVNSYLWMAVYHAGHTRKASRISKAAVENCGKGVGNFYLS